MLFGKFLSAEEIKTAHDKKKARKKLIFELTQDSIVHKLREDLELSKSRADHFEREFFDLKKSHEVLNDCYKTIAEADQQLKAELYELTLAIKVKDETISDFTKGIENAISKIAKLTEENEALRIRIKELEPELTTEEVNDQINQILTKK